MVRYSKEDVLDQTEKLAIIGATKNLKERFLIKCALFQGMRAGEIANMQKAWVRWQDNLIHIPSSEGEWSPKTKQSVRDIPIHPEFKPDLVEWFKNKDKVGITRVSIYRNIKNIAKRSNLPKKVYPHSLRATYASMLAGQGIPSSDIQYVLGWAKLETANNYIRSTTAIENIRKKWENG